MTKIYRENFETITAEVTGKSEDIMIKYFEDEKGMIPLWFVNAVFEGDFVWFSSVDFNGLFKGNVLTGEVEFIDIFEEEDIGADWIHWAVEKIDNQIYFIPDLGSLISVFNIESNKFVKKIEIPFTHKTMRKIVYSCVVDKSIFLFGQDLEIFKLNTQNYEIHFCKQICEQLQKVGFGKVFNSEVTLKDGKLFVPIYMENKLVEVDLINESVAKIHMINSDIELFGCYFDGEEFWLSGGDSIIQCDSDLKIKREFRCATDKGVFNFQNIREIKGKLIFFDNQNKGKMILDKDKKKWSYVFMDRKRQKIKSRWNNCVFFLSNENKDYYFDVDDYTLKKISDDTLNVRFLINRETVVKKLKCKKRRLIDEKEILFEDDKVTTLETWIKNIVGMN